MQCRVSKPVISVIIIFFNTEAFIEEAIASVINQTYQRWELLLVDDGSTDGSTIIAQRYARRWPGKVRYLQHPEHRNQGMSASRNLGLRYARGDFVSFLDADDVWFPYTLTQQAAAMETHPEAGMILGATEYWYSWTGDPGDRRRDSCDFLHASGIRLNKLLKPPEYLICFLSNTAALPGICSTIARRAIIHEVGGFEEQFRNLHEDQVYLAKMALHTPIYVTDHCWARYRRHPNSTCAIAERNGEIPAANAFFLSWLSTYLGSQDVRDARVWSALKEYH